ncbi:hypothetical protein OV142_29400 [Nannocystis sp. SCPEA4]|nr:hypothetical protein [Nannocystis sp. SCPEA4]
MNLSNRQLISRAALAAPVCLSLLAAACSEPGGRDSASAGATYGVITTVQPGAVATTEEDSADVPTTSEGTGTGTSSSTGAADETGAPGEEPQGEPSDSGPKFDLGDSPDPADPGGQADKPCVKIDLLFVVDNSSSMKQEQVNLVASFPTFVSEMQDQLADAESLHIGVVSTDDYEYNEPGCTDTLGALVTQTGGEGSSDAVCGPYASGKRFMTQDDDLPARFTCAAQVGIDGSGDEMPIDAALAALGPDLAGPGGCNEQFMREDALLVLVIITDEEEDGSAGDPPQWFSAITALKGGIETNIVVLSLIGPKNPACKDAAEIGERLTEFTEMFTYGSVGQICAANYQMFFHDAITGIAEACGGFTPPG